MSKHNEAFGVFLSFMVSKHRGALGERHHLQTELTRKFCTQKGKLPFGQQLWFDRRGVKGLLHVPTAVRVEMNVKWKGMCWGQQTKIFHTEPSFLVNCYLIIKKPYRGKFSRKEWCKVTRWMK